MAKRQQQILGWGSLNVALNTLVRTGVISAYKTNRPENDNPALIEVTVPPGADQAEVVDRVRQSLTTEFADATVRTRQM